MNRNTVIDKNITYFNLIMRCDIYEPKEILLPTGYSFRGYRDGDAREWARIEVEVNDFDTFDNALKYFTSKYLSNVEELEKRFICVENQNKEVVGIVIAWFEIFNDDAISAVHWLVTSPDEAGKGIGTALVQKMLSVFHNLNAFPVYLHTQPWSYKAVGIYSQCGFNILKNDSFKGYKNQYQEGLPILKQYMKAELFAKLVDEAI